jgi:hypothetical protein
LYEPFHASGAAADAMTLADGDALGGADAEGVAEEEAAIAPSCEE